MSVLEPGIYVLTETVENPLGDGRVRHDWREQKEIKAGTEFVVRDAAMPALEIDGAPFTRREIYLRRGYSHQSLYVDMKGESKRYALLQALSERLQRKEDSRARFDFWCADNWLEVSGTARDLLYQAFLEGRIDLDWLQSKYDECARRVEEGS